MNLQLLANKHSVALFDLVEKCKDPKYEFMPYPGAEDGSSEILQRLKLIDADGNVGGIVKVIVLNSTKGEGLDSC